MEQLKPAVFQQTGPCEQCFPDWVLMWKNGWLMKGALKDNETGRRNPSCWWWAGRWCRWLRHFWNCCFQKLQIILADTQLSFHIISPNPVGNYLLKNHSQGHFFPVDPIPPSDMSSHWPTSNEGAEGAALVRHSKEKGCISICTGLHNRVNLYFEGLTDILISKAKWNHSFWGFFPQHVSFITIPLLKSPSKQIFLCDCEEMFWGSENGFAFPSKENKGRQDCRNENLCQIS